MFVSWLGREFDVMCCRSVSLVWRHNCGAVTDFRLRDHTVTDYVHIVTCLFPAMLVSWLGREFDVMCRRSVSLVWRHNCGAVTDFRLRDHTVTDYLHIVTCLFPAILVSWLGREFDVMCRLSVSLVWRHNCGAVADFRLRGHT
ncbi:hypothetical protein AVEN_215071-1 [Araneus ventricosus]|uniref:Uncharacterized protein n=1 Tax=Araneus ventricosus TaxID=182803 RepID=A0A4Y1ZL85_ARAVE|nr:hypothetical protein AVEN_119639-1 [Araneus ventricosus]GBL55502.1 hypothetical protein AVEN_215071-1 [Araneus ventricosus]